MNKITSKLEIKNDIRVSAKDIPFRIPADLSDFLNCKGGAMGMLGDDSYVNLYSGAEILKLNDDYAVEEFLPEYLLIGTVNDEALVIDKDSNYYLVPFIGMFKKNCVKIAESLRELLDNLESNHFD